MDIIIKLEKMKMPIEMCNHIYSFVGKHKCAEIISDGFQLYHYFFNREFIEKYDKILTTNHLIEKSQRGFKFDGDFVWIYTNLFNKRILSGIRGISSKIKFDIECKKAIKHITKSFEEINKNLEEEDDDDEYDEYLEYPDNEYDDDDELEYIEDEDDDYN